ncbi:monocarboxylate transporter 12 [Ixodes scapularis]
MPSQVNQKKYPPYPRAVLLLLSSSITKTARQQARQQIKQNFPFFNRRVKMCPPLKTNNEKKKGAGVDTCWHVAALGFLVIFLGTAAQSNSAFFYVGFMEQFGVNREIATWPGSIGTAFSHLAAIFVALFQRKVSLFTIFLLGALFIWSGIVASAFVPTMAWMTVTFGVIQGLGSGVISLTYSILLAMYFDKYRGLTSGLKFAGGSLGGLVFPKFLPYLQNEYGFRGLGNPASTPSILKKDELSGDTPGERGRSGSIPRLPQNERQSRRDVSHGPETRDSSASSQHRSRSSSRCRSRSIQGRQNQRRKSRSPS